MNPPDWSCCTEEELWHYVGWHLEVAGVSSVLVGGAVVAIYTGGLYRSGDLDLIPNDLHRRKIPDILRRLGFQSSKSRYFKHPQCPHLFLEFPRGPVEIGEECPVVPDEIEVSGRKLQLLSPTDCVKDRLAGYIHWKSRANFEQALLVCRKQAHRVDLKAVEQWCKQEGGLTEFIELQQLLAGPG